MTVDEIVQTLSARGVVLEASADELRFSGPKGAVDATLRAAMAAAKPELIRHLSGGDPTPAQATPRPSKRFSIGGRRPVHSALVDPAAMSDHPFGRYVEPYKAYLLEHLGIAREYRRAEGMWMWDTNGRAVLDCLSQYGALPFGHNPAPIWRALQAVRDSGEPPFAANSMLGAAGALAERLVGLWPEAGFTNVVFTNSGAEAVEAAIKLCRAATGRRAVLSTRGGFHGLTLGALALGGSAVYREGFGVETDDADQIPHGDTAALEAAFARHPSRYAAVIIEPIQGEAGIIDAPGTFLQTARRLCDAKGALLIVDEVQTGLGRTGALFAAQSCGGAHGVVGDVVTLAKALGGGLMPIGACLYRPTARSELFGLRHSSTFAGGALACRAGLATLDLLTEQDGALLHRVRTTGDALRAGLVGLSERFPDLVLGLSGRGLMQGVRLNLAGCWALPGILGLMHDQKILIHLVVSHLLNAGGVRVAPSFSAGEVLRIQPALIATPDHVATLLRALEDTLDALREGDAARLLGHLIEPGAPARRRSPVSRPAGPAPRRPTPNPPAAEPGVARFAFAVHPLSWGDLPEVDPSLAGIDPERIGRAMGKLADYIDPLPIEALEIRSASGARAYGELILIPHTPDELMAMPLDKAVEEIELAVLLAQERGAQIVGLGGFTSIVTRGGMALAGKGLPALTSGNAFTAISAKQAVLAACADRGLDPVTARVAIVGAGGMVGRAVATLLGARFGALNLVGNPNHAGAQRARHVRMGEDIIAQLRELAALEPPPFGSLGALASTAGDDAVDQFERTGRLLLTADLATGLRDADVVVTATNATSCVITAAHLRRGAIVCDVSRPLNVHPDVSRQRPDVYLIEGGVVRLPSSSGQSLFVGPRPGLAFACAAETMLWALEGAQDRVTPDGCMRVGALLELEAMGKRHGLQTEHAPFCDDGEMDLPEPIRAVG